ncbi:hypothetical protein DPMN_007016 [Dreissena polymorpha]|uniref:Uncharacterized protein n=1 Tax=Dreissena polymorpha TaxID=45954 RepID=A0A9D4MSY1_DREPO|nr:hypothetical protein DPMN_007016 [Dreissena polymorpha]
MEDQSRVSGTVGPDTCVLHSESMRKACMYVRQKALSGTSSSGTGGDTGGEVGGTSSTGR